MSKTTILLAAAAIGLAACNDNESPAPAGPITTSALAQKVIAEDTSDSALPTSLNDGTIVDDTSDSDEPAPLS